jgi:hypothetical protein
VPAPPANASPIPRAIQQAAQRTRTNLCRDHRLSSGHGFSRAVSAVAHGACPSHPRLSRRGGAFAFAVATVAPPSRWLFVVALVFLHRHARRPRAIQQAAQRTRTNLCRGDRLSSGHGFSRAVSRSRIRAPSAAEAMSLPLARRCLRSATVSVALRSCPSIRPPSPAPSACAIQQAAQRTHTNLCRDHRLSSGHGRRRLAHGASALEVQRHLLTTSYLR